MDICTNVQIECILLDGFISVDILFVFQVWKRLLSYHRLLFGNGYSDFGRSTFISLKCGARLTCSVTGAKVREDLSLLFLFYSHVSPTAIAYARLFFWV